MNIGKTQMQLKKKYKSQICHLLSLDQICQNFKLMGFLTPRMSIRLESIIKLISNEEQKMHIVRQAIQQTSFLSIVQRNRGIEIEESVSIRYGNQQLLIMIAGIEKSAIERWLKQFQQYRIKQNDELAISSKLGYIKNDCGLWTGVEAKNPQMAQKMMGFFRHKLKTLKNLQCSSVSQSRKVRIVLASEEIFQFLIQTMSDLKNEHFMNSMAKTKKITINKLKSATCFWYMPIMQNTQIQSQNSIQTLQIQKNVLHLKATMSQLSLEDVNQKHQKISINKKSDSTSLQSKEQQKNSDENVQSQQFFSVETYSSCEDQNKELEINNKL